MTTKPAPAINLTDACTMAIAAGTASDYANRAEYGQVRAALEKLSLRFAGLALEALGSEPGQAGSDEASSA